MLRIAKQVLFENSILNNYMDVFVTILNCIIYFIK